MWQTFLDEMLPDVTKQAVLAEFFGYVFLRNLKLEKALVLYGSGANGKSVVFDVINALLGDTNVTNYSLESLGEPYFRGKLANGLLNYCSDVSGRMQAATFKLMVSGEPIEARFPYGQPFMMRNYARLAFNTNELPRADVEHTEAFFRRFLIIQFDEVIPDARRNPNLAKEIIQSELAGVFNWVLLGLLRLIENGRFTESQAVNSSLTEFRTETNSVAMFLEEGRFIPSESVRISLSNLYRQYRSFCSESGYKAEGKQTFSKRLKIMGLILERKAAGMFVLVDQQ